MTEAIGRFIRQSIFSYKALFGWISPKAYITSKIVGPIFQLLFFCLLTRYSYGSENIARWVVGNSLVFCYLNAFFGIGTIMTNERAAGTLKLVVAAPYSKFLTFLGRSLMHVLDGIFNVALSLFTGIILFRIDLSGINMTLFAFNILAAVISASGLGLTIGSLGLVVKDTNLMLNTASTALLALTGANFPIEKLPLLLQKLAYCLPLTRSIQAAGLLLQGANASRALELMLLEIALGTAYTLLGYFLLQLMEGLSRKKAALDLF